MQSKVFYAGLAIANQCHDRTNWNPSEAGLFMNFFCFRRQDPVTFEGDLTNDEAILNWLTSQEVFSIGDEIEEVNRKMLEKLLEENDFVAVYFCKYCRGYVILEI